MFPNANKTIVVIIGRVDNQETFRFNFSRIGFRFTLDGSTLGES